MNKKADPIHIYTQLDFFPEKNTLVLKDKNGFINKNYGFTTFFCCYPTISYQMMSHHDHQYHIMKSSYTQMLC